MSISSENEIKKIYQKSIHLLNDKQAQLSKLRQVLKKAVIRLSLASRGDNGQINNVLKEIHLSVDDRIDLDRLNKQLDKLFVLINQEDDCTSKPEIIGFYTSFKKSLDDLNNQTLADEYISKLKLLVDKKLPDAEMSCEILSLFGTVVERNIKHADNINSFIEDITDRTDFEYEQNDEDVSELLQDLSNKLTEYIYSLDQKEVIDKTYDQADEQGSKINTNHVLSEIINRLTLPSKLKKDQLSLVKKLAKSTADKLHWKDITQHVVSLVNDGIAYIQREKNELQSYLNKINGQLADVETFMHDMYREGEESKTRSLELIDSVETDVNTIDEVVSLSDNITELKKNVALSLNSIRKRVEEFKKADEIKEELSTQSFARIIKELSNTQNESEKLKEELQESQIQLLRDTLTGIPNRLAYEERVEVEMQRWKRNKKPLCLAMWDIDHFKNVNDNFGHNIGDRVLSLFASIIQSKIRKVDFLARIGGEEFVLLMPETSLDNALKLNNDLRELLESSKFHYNGQYCPVTSSIGIAEFQQGDEVEDVLKRADKALYKSKISGRNCCTAI